MINMVGQMPKGDGNWPLTSPYLQRWRLYKFIEKNYLLFKQQYGFRNKMPTNHALIDIINRIQEVCDNGQYACGNYVDFKKGFGFKKVFD